MLFKSNILSVMRQLSNMSLRERESDSYSSEHGLEFSLS